MQFPEGYEITDYGYPNYEDVVTYLEGGTVHDPELFISNPIALGFLLNKVVINKEPIGVQFRLLEQGQES